MGSACCGAGPWAAKPLCLVSALWRCLYICELSAPSPCNLCSSPYKGIRAPSSAGFAQFPADTNVPSLLLPSWHTHVMSLSCSCGQVLHLRAKLSFFLVPVLLWDHWDESWDKSCLCCLSLLTFHVLFACTLLLLVWAGGIALHVDSSAMIVLYCEQIALLVCAFLFPGYWSYKLIKLIPILISMAVYALQPKLLSFNYSFSSITQPVLSPLRQLHLYNSQYPRNDLPEQPLPILPFVQTLLYSFPECDHFFLCSWQKEKKKRERDNVCNVCLTKDLDMKIIISGKNEIILHVHSSFHFKRQRLPMLLME